MGKPRGPKLLSVNVAARLESKATARRLAIAQTALVDCVMRDPRTGAVLESWYRDIGMFDLTSAFQGASSATDDALEDLTTRFLAALERPSDTVETYVRDSLGLTWPWVTPALTVFFRARALILVGALPKRRMGFSAKLNDPPAPAMTFTTRPGETVSQAAARLRELASEVEAAGALPQGRAPKNSGRSVARDVHWWYLHHVEGKKIPSLIAARHDSMDERTLREGIKRAGELLERVGNPER